jgi:Fe-S oxidoreductase
VGDAKKLRAQVKLLGELLTGEGSTYAPPRLARKAIGQGHCHHKSVLGYDDERALLEKMGLDFELLPSGCCGMAGAFGFEAGEKERLSRAAGERVLLPAVRAAEASTWIVADGFSCRTQIEQGTHRRGLHVAEVVAMALDDRDRGAHSPPPPDGQASPEEAMAARHRTEIRRSMVRAAAGLAAGVVALGAAVVALRRWRV